MTSMDSLYTLIRQLLNNHSRRVPKMLASKPPRLNSSLRLST